MFKKDVFYVDPKKRGSEPVEFLEKEIKEILCAVLQYLQKAKNEVSLINDSTRKSRKIRRTRNKTEKAFEGAVKLYFANSQSKNGFNQRIRESDFEDFKSCMWNFYQNNKKIEC